MVYTWQCPLCIDACGYFERLTELGLCVATATHIQMHMECASLCAVYNARLKCTETTCSLGTSKKLNMDSGLFEPRLTEYDIKFLNGLKIKIG